MFSRSFEDMGIPPGYGFKQLLFCPRADTLVVHVESVHNWRPERLYFRKHASERYVSVPARDDLISQEDPVVLASEPLLAYNTLRHRFDIDGEGIERHGADWDSVRVFDLRAGEETGAWDPTTITFPEGVTDGWISRLLSLGEDVNVLHVVAAISRNRRISMEYYVSELQLVSGLVRPLALLPAVFM